MYENVKMMSFTDGMTGLNNYRYFDNRLREELKRAQRAGSRVSLIMLDIDHFKNYNDSLGHQSGDEALRKLGLILRNTAREDDIVNRYGGEEFSVILPGIEKVSISVLAERLRKTVEKEVFFKQDVQPGGSLTISLGAATYPDDADSFEQLITKADQALYHSKKNGRNRFTIYDDSLEAK
jgi:diguanylate cyclase (GGDEF)-like protein